MGSHSDGNSQVSASKQWLTLAELTCNWQPKRGNSRKFHGARGTLMYMYLNPTFTNWYCRTGILIRWVNYLPSINSARYTQRIIQTVKSRLTADCPPMSIVSEKVHRLARLSLVSDSVTVPCECDWLSLCQSQTVSVIITCTEYNTNLLVYYYKSNHFYFESVSI